jgi:hypothetical protein
MIKINNLVLIVALILFGWPRPIAASDWAEAPANLTIQEFLENHFTQILGKEESDAINSYNLVFFYPSSEPHKAFVFIIQAWRDSQRTDRNIRRDIRALGEVYFKHFNSRIYLPTIRKRWKLKNSKENFIIKHVRHSDIKETLAVTVDGKTHFDDETIKRTAISIKRRGGIWSF